MSDSEPPSPGRGGGPANPRRGLGEQHELAKYARLLQWQAIEFRPVRVPGRGGGDRWIMAAYGDSDGVPDLLLWRGPRLIWREVKVGASQPDPTERQAKRLAELSRVRRFESGIWRPDREMPDIIEDLR